MLNSRRCVEVEDGSFVYIDPAVHLTWQTSAVIASRTKLRAVYHDQRHAVTVDDAAKLVADGYAYAVGDRLFERPDLCRTVFDWDDSAEIEFIDRYLSGRSGSGRGIEYGCGNGRLLLPLRARGHVLDGLDVSEPAVRWLSRRVETESADGADRGDLILADMAAFSAPGRYDYALAGLNTLRYLPSHAELRRHLHLAALSVVPGGGYLMLVDSWAPAAEPTPDGSSGEWTTPPGEDGAPLRVVWTKVRHDPMDRMDLERVEVYRGEERIVDEHQTQLALPLRGWVAAFEADGEWRVASVHLDDSPEAVEVTDLDEPGSGNFWFTLERTDVTAEALFTR